MADDNPNRGGAAAAAAARAAERLAKEQSAKAAPTTAETLTEQGAREALERAFGAPIEFGTGSTDTGREAPNPMSDEEKKAKAAREAEAAKVLCKYPC